MYEQLFVFKDKFQCMYVEKNLNFKYIENYYNPFYFKIFKKDTKLNDFLDSLNNKEATHNDLENLIKTNYVNDDSDYVRKVYSFENEDGIYSVCKSDYFDEFFIGVSNTNLVYDMTELKEVPLEEFNSYDMFQRAVIFKKFLSENESNDFNYTEFDNLALRKDKNDNIYFVFNTPSKNLIVSEEFITKATNQYYLELGIKDTLSNKYNTVFENKENKSFVPSLKNQEQQEARRKIFQQFIDLSNGKEYLDNELLLQIAEIADIAIQTIENPPIGTIKLGGFLLSTFTINKNEELNNLTSGPKDYVISFTEGLVSDLGIKEFSQTISKETVELIKTLDKEYIKNKVLDKATESIKKKVIEAVPIEINEKEETENKDKREFEL